MIAVSVTDPGSLGGWLVLIALTGAWALLRALLIDLLFVNVCCRLTRAVVGRPRWKRVERCWVGVNQFAGRAQPNRASTPNLACYLAYALILASFAPHFVAICVNLARQTDSRVAFAYQFLDAPAFNYTAAEQSMIVLTSVEIRSTEPQIRAWQLDSSSGLVLAAVSSNQSPPLPPALSRLLDHSTPSCFHVLYWLAFIAFILTGVAMLPVAWSACRTCAEVWAERVRPCAQPWYPEFGFWCWLLTVLPAALALVAQLNVASRFTLTAVGRPALELYASAVASSAGWLLALLSCTCARGETERPSGDADKDVQAVEPLLSEDEGERLLPQYDSRPTADGGRESDSDSERGSEAAVALR